MISPGLERRLAVIATAALTLAIWALPASAAPRPQTSGPKAADRIGGVEGLGIASRNVIP
jgi:hypothetical protein